MMKFFEKNWAPFYFAFRVLVGVGFLLHGWMKVQSLMGGSLQIASLMGLAMIIEVVGGAFLILGLFVKETALVGAIEMLVAFFYMHVMGSGTINPLANKGEAAMLYFAAFLVLMCHGGGKWGIDKYKAAK